MKIEVMPDGTTRFSYRQSWINTFMKCPEQARLDMEGLLPRSESDALAIGTSVHTAIESRLRGATFANAMVDGLETFDKLSATEGFKWVKVKTDATAHAHIGACFRAWESDVFPRLGDPISIEQHFQVQLDYNRYDEELWLHGTWDFEDDNGVWDWKTGGKYYEEWEARRYFVQPTVYTFAHAQINGCEPVDFNYAVMLKGPNPSPAQVFGVQRDRSHHMWLAKQLWDIVDLWKCHLDHWPTNDQGWWCSPKWCPAYEACKGAHLDPI